MNTANEKPNEIPDPDKQRELKPAHTPDAPVLPKEQPPRIPPEHPNADRPKEIPKQP